MSELRDEIRSGAFAREWLAEVAAGKPVLTRLLEEADGAPIETGRRLALGGENAPSPAGGSPGRPAESK